MGVVSSPEAPTLHLICSDLDEINGTTKPTSSVVEWATRCATSLFQHTGTTDHLINIYQPQHPMLFQYMQKFRLCFESLCDESGICLYLQSFEVVELTDSHPKSNWVPVLRNYRTQSWHGVLKGTRIYPPGGTAWTVLYHRCIFIYCYALSLILPCF